MSFERDFYLNDKVGWARQKQRWRCWRQRGEGVLISIIAGVIVWIGVTLLPPMTPKADSTSGSPSIVHDDRGPHIDPSGNGAGHAEHQ